MKYRVFHTQNMSTMWFESGKLIKDSTYTVPVNLTILNYQKKIPKKQKPPLPLSPLISLPPPPPHIKINNNNTHLLKLLKREKVHIDWQILNEILVDFICQKVVRSRFIGEVDYLPSKPLKSLLCGSNVVCNAL